MNAIAKDCGSCETNADWHGGSARQKRSKQPHLMAAKFIHEFGAGNPYWLAEKYPFAF